VDVQVIIERVVDVQFHVQIGDRHIPIDEQSRCRHRVVLEGDRRVAGERVARTQHRSGEIGEENGATSQGLVEREAGIGNAARSSEQSDATAVERLIVAQLARSDAETPIGGISS